MGFYLPSAGGIGEVNVPGIGGIQALGGIGFAPGAPAGVTFDSYIQSLTPVAYWRMDSVVNDATEADVSGSANQHDLTFTTPANIATAASVIIDSGNQAMTLNTSTNSSGATAAHHADFNIPATGFAVEAWINVASTDLTVDTFPVIVEKGDINTSLVLFIDNSAALGGRVSFAVRMNSSVNVLSSTDIVAGESYYVAAVLDDSGFLHIYVNRILEASSASAITPGNNTGPVYVGQSNGPGNKLKSIIDEVVVYRKELSQATVTETYNNGLQLASTIWNPSDKDINITLLEANLRVQQNGGGFGGVRSEANKTTGKWYWENTLLVTGNTTIGICNSSQDVTSGLHDATQTALTQSGVIYDKGTAVFTGTALSINDVVSMVVDSDAETIIFWVNGTVFGSGSGYSFTAWSEMYAWVTNLSTAALLDVRTNFGDSAFTYTPPVGHVGLSQ